MRITWKVWQPIARRWGRAGLIVAAIAATAIVVGGGGVLAALLGGTGKTVDASNIDLQKGLMGWWKLDGNAKDATPYGHNGTISGTVVAATDRENASNKAMSLSGATVSYIDTGYNYPYTNFTVAIWAKPDGTGPNGFASIISNSRDCCSTYSGFQLEYNKSNTAYARLWAGGSTPAMNLNAPVVLNTWQQFTLSYDGSTFKLYKNGSLVSSGAYSGTIAASAYDVFIGRMGAISGGYSFGGLLDDARIYSRALSDAEVTALYNQYDPSLKSDAGESGLIGEWKMDGNAKDSTPFGNNGTLMNTVLPTSDRKGNSTGAYLFDGTTSTGGYINLPATNAYDVGVGQAKTFSIWFKASTQTHTGFIFYKNGGCLGWLMALYPNGAVVGAIGTGSSGCTGTNYYYATTTGTNYADSHWHLLTLVIDRPGGGSNEKLYVDGVVAALSTVDNTYGAASGGDTHIGTDWNDGYPFAGSLDDARIYNRALSASEIKNIYNSYNSQVNLLSNPNAAPHVNLGVGLVGSWPFNGNAKDTTPYSDNGTLSGSPPVLTSDRKGRANSAYSFNGTSQHIWLPSGSFPTSKITVSAWTKQSTLANWYNVASINWMTNGGWDLYTDASGDPSFGIYQGSVYTASCGASSFTAGAWHHLVGTYDGSTIRLYLDGVACSYTSSLAGETLNNSGGYVSLGANGVSTQLMDDVQMWNRALSPAEVTALYNFYQ